jgi:hypothetical protein
MPQQPERAPYFRDAASAASKVMTMTYNGVDFTATGG